MSITVYDLVIDSLDRWGEEKNTFHLKPEKTQLICCLDNQRFISCSIFNTPVDVVTPKFLSSLYDKLISKATVLVVINQPIAIMQEYDAKQIEANAKCCGYINITISSYEIEEKDYKYMSLAVMFERPERVEEEPISITKVVVEKVEKVVVSPDRRVSPSKK